MSTSTEIQKIVVQFLGDAKQLQQQATVAETAVKNMYQRMVAAGGVLTNFQKQHLKATEDAAKRTVNGINQQIKSINSIGVAATKAYAQVEVSLNKANAAHSRHQESTNNLAMAGIRRYERELQAKAALQRSHDEGMVQRAMNHRARLQFVSTLLTGGGRGGGGGGGGLSGFVRDPFRFVGGHTGMTSHGGRGMFGHFENVFTGVSMAYVARSIVHSFTEWIQGAFSIGLEQIRSRKTFEIFTGSEQTGNRLFTDIRKLAVDTPYQSVDLQNHAQTLLSYGIGDKQIVPTLSRLGDIAGGDNERMRRLVLAYSQVTAAGNFKGQELRQFAEAGVGASDFASANNMTTAEFRNKMQHGEISVNMMIEGINKMTEAGGRFYNMSNQINKTVYGQWNAMKENIQFFAGDTVERFFERFKVGMRLGSLNDQIANNPNLKNNFIDKVLNGFESMFNLFREGWRYVDAVYKGFKSIFSSLGDGIDFVSIKSSIESIFKLFITLAGAWAKYQIGYYMVMTKMAISLHDVIVQDLLPYLGYRDLTANSIIDSKAADQALTTMGAFIGVDKDFKLLPGKGLINQFDDNVSNALSGNKGTSGSNFYEGKNYFGMAGRINTRDKDGINVVSDDDVNIARDRSKKAYAYQGAMDTIPRDFSSFIDAYADTKTKGGFKKYIGSDTTRGKTEYTDYFGGSANPNWKHALLPVGIGLPAFLQDMMSGKGPGYSDKGITQLNFDNFMATRSVKTNDLFIKEGASKVYSQEFFDKYKDLSSKPKTTKEEKLFLEQMKPVVDSVESTKLKYAAEKERVLNYREEAFQAYKRVEGEKDKQKDLVSKIGLQSLSLLGGTGLLGSGFNAAAGGINDFLWQEAAKGRRDALIAKTWALSPEAMNITKETREAMKKQPLTEFNRDMDALNEAFRGKEINVGKIFGGMLKVTPGVMDRDAFEFGNLKTFHALQDSLSSRLKLELPPAIKAGSVEAANTINRSQGSPQNTMEEIRKTLEEAKKVAEEQREEAKKVTGLLEDIKKNGGVWVGP